MNVYDFDKTIYNGDSSLDFYFYCLKKYPRICFYIPTQIYGFLLYLVGIYRKVEFKEKFYTFLNGIDNIDNIVNDFWLIHKDKIKDWYKKKKHPTDIIISASPEFLLLPICLELDIRLIASKVDKISGKYDGENCYGEFKVDRFYYEYNECTIDEFYSDSLTDTPLAKIANQSYIVDKNNILKWSDYKPTGMKRMKLVFLSRDFLLFLIIGFINVLNGILFAYIYSWRLNPNLAFILGYLTSLVFSYILNSYLIFKEQINFIKYIKFCISYIPNFVIQNVVVLIFLNVLGWNKLVVYIQAAIIGIPITYILIKYFAFRRR